MELHRASLRRDELEALQEPRRQTRVAADRRPLLAIEATRFSQHRRVDGDLAEIVQAPGPAEPVDLRERQLQRTRETVHIAGDADRVTIRRGIALVDDVRERLEGAQRLPLESQQPRMGLVDGQAERDDDHDVPGMPDRERRSRRAAARSFRAGRACAGVGPAPSGRRPRA